MRALKANTRMYNLSPEVEAIWARLIARVSALAGLPLEMLPHPAPTPVEALWARPDLGLVLMCGWPYHCARPQPIPVAAPVLRDDAARGRPVYWSDMIVRADGPAHNLEDTFGQTLGWTVEGSHSGYNAPRHLLTPFFTARGGPLYRQTIGPLITPRAAIEAVLAGSVTVSPLDAVFHLLLQRHEPETAARLRTVARTPQAPIPLFTASPGADAGATEALRKALIALHEDDEGAALMQDLSLARFVAVNPADYALTQHWHDAAHAAGYPAPA